MNKRQLSGAIAGPLLVFVGGVIFIPGAIYLLVGFIEPLLSLLAGAWLIRQFIRKFL